MIFTVDKYKKFLNQPTNDVDATDPYMAELTQKMFDVVRGVGIGLAANQIGQKLNLAIMQLEDLETDQGNTDKMIVCIMPSILYPISVGQNMIYVTEGCLSIPGKQYLVPRIKEVSLVYLDLEGNHKKLKLTGLAAVVAQHEVDHCNGKLICDIGKSIIPATGQA
jgi:peptide deformylase